MKSVLARKEGLDASRSCSFRMRRRAMAACGAGGRVGVCDDMLSREDAPVARVPFLVSGADALPATSGSATSTSPPFTRNTTRGHCAEAFLPFTPCCDNDCAGHQKDAALGASGRWWDHQGGNEGGSGGTRFTPPATRRCCGEGRQGRTCNGVQILGPGNRADGNTSRFTKLATSRTSRFTKLVSFLGVSFYFRPLGGCVIQLIRAN
ncbi:hypothetical protein T484DRAFT_3637613 [Baffinella frigidus]|nr:hypothetical protein T484DRAFT_3637613 [Cryptophyta sp. CCMP2293]